MVGSWGNHQGEGAIRRRRSWQLRTRRRRDEVVCRWWIRSSEECDLAMVVVELAAKEGSWSWWHDRGVRLTHGRWWLETEGEEDGVMVVVRWKRRWWWGERRFLWSLGAVVVRGDEEGRGWFGAGSRWWRTGSGWSLLQCGGNMIDRGWVHSGGSKGQWLGVSVWVFLMLLLLLFFLIFLVGVWFVCYKFSVCCYLNFGL